MGLRSLCLAALIGSTIAIRPPTLIEKRQTTANDVIRGGCKKVTLIFARASTEAGNMGASMGPAVCSGLKRKFVGQVACQGVGRPYTAGLADNVRPAGTTPAAINEATKMFTQAASKCPSTTIVAGGYSQGTAVMMNAISKLPQNIKNRIAGVVLFGYTKNKQTRSSIPGYPKERVAVYCSKSDGVCGGSLVVTAGHFSYLADGSGPKATNFLVSHINGGGGGGALGGLGGLRGGSKGLAKGGKGKFGKGSG